MPNKKFTFLWLIFTVISASCSEANRTYTVEFIDGVRHVHNLAPKWGDNPKIAIELVKTFGGLEETDEKYMLYRPQDVALDKEGNIMILDMGNHRIQIYTPDGKFLDSFGQKGQGPGEFLSPFGIQVNAQGEIFVSDRSLGTEVFDSQKKYLRTIEATIRQFRISLLKNGNIINQNFRTDGRVGFAENLVKIIDKEGKIISQFAEKRKGGDGRIVSTPAYTVDEEDNIFVAFSRQNRIEKYTSRGELRMKITRELGYEETLTFEMKQAKDSSGKIRNFQNVNHFSYAIQLDSKARIWVHTFARQATDLERAERKYNENIYKLEVFHRNGVLLQNIAEDNFKHMNNFRIFGDNLFIVDPNKEMAVYQYKIIEN